MAFTILFVLLMTPVFILSSIIFVLPALFLKLIGLKKASMALIAFSEAIFPRLLVLASGSKVTVHGIENFPPPGKRDRLCLISNHQSYFDILLVMGFLPGVSGFVAKKELFRVPFLNIWMYGVGSIKIDRSSPRSAVKAIENGTRSIQKGWPVMIFPEGTRSKSNIVGNFKQGSLKLATRSKSTLIPLSIEGTADVFEAQGRIRKADIHLTVHPPIETTELTGDEKKELPARLRHTIIQGGSTLVAKEKQ